MNIDSIDQELTRPQDRRFNFSCKPEDLLVGEL